MNWEIILFNFCSNRMQLLQTFVCCFILGMVLALMTVNINKEKRKKGFSEEDFYGTEEEIDKQMYNEYKDFQEIKGNSYLNDNMEHHASKKYK